MLEQGFLTNDLDPCLFVKNSMENMIMVILYVDDILVECRNVSKIYKIKHNLSKKFSMKDLVSPNEFLVIHTERNLSKKLLTMSLCN